jgi:hypothetical protein
MQLNHIITDDTVTPCATSAYHQAASGTNVVWPPIDSAALQAAGRPLAGYLTDSTYSTQAGSVGLAAGRGPL